MLYRIGTNTALFQKWKELMVSHKRLSLESVLQNPMIVSGETLNEEIQNARKELENLNREWQELANQTFNYVKATTEANPITEEEFDGMFSDYCSYLQLRVEPDVSEELEDIEEIQQVRTCVHSGNYSNPCSLSTCPFARRKQGA